MQNENFLLAVFLSILILVGFHYMYEKPVMEQHQQQQLALKAEDEAKSAAPAPVDIPERGRADIIKETSRIAINTSEARGSINLVGGRIDDLELVKYKETVDPDSPTVVLLSPAGSAMPHPAYYAEFGWLGNDIKLPDDKTVWKSKDKTLTPEKPVKLTWDNGQGLSFERTIAIDDAFMFTVTDSVRNNGSATATLFPYSLVSRHGKPHTQDAYSLHEGPLGAIGGVLKEYKYKDLLANARMMEESTGGWLGMTDKYWLVALIPNQSEKITTTFAYAASADNNPDKGTFQADYRGTAISLAPGASADRTSYLFAGAKRVRLLDDYEKKMGIALFDRAIDFGWYYYLTKPFLYLLDYLDGVLGHMGWAIIVFTIMLKIATLPLSMKSYRSMARMKAIQPQIKEIQERYKDDKQRQGIEQMELYKREKINPLSGCVPMLVQIPIFYALYKVLNVGIEMRQAPLFGWIKDMSVPDPTSVLTLFGWLDWSWIPHLGVWPILMGLSMFIQQKLSPQATDKTQAQVFALMPLMFTFMMANVAVGLIFYWTMSNLLGLAQQWLVMRNVTERKA